MDKLAAEKIKKIAILGAGSAGLAAGLRLARKGYKVSVFEKNRNVGGLGGGIVINGNIYEYGPHLFHTTDPEVFADIREIAGDALFPIERTALIKFMGSYFKYPLSIPNVIFKLPKIIILKAFFSFIGCNLKAMVVKPYPETSETVLLKNYGRVLYELFFKDYVSHVWGIPASGFSPKFASQRIPRLSSINFLFKLISFFGKIKPKKISPSDHVEHVEGQVYSTKKGFSVIAEKMAGEVRRLGGEIHTDSDVTKLKRLENGTFMIEANFRAGTEVFDGVINTIPINNLARILDPALSTEAIRSAENLKFRSIVFVGLLIAKSKVLPAAILYFREYSFNRIIDLSYFGFETNPEGCAMLVAEISCGREDRFWKDDQYSKDSVIGELIKEGLITKEMIKEAHVFKTEYAYPIYTLGFEEHLSRILKEVDSYGNLYTSGRQGLFQYSNIHIAIKTAYEAADSLALKLRGR